MERRSRSRPRARARGRSGWRTTRGPSSSSERRSELEIHVDVDHDRRGRVLEDDPAVHRADDHSLERPLALAAAVIARSVVDYLGHADPLDANDVEALADEHRAGDVHRAIGGDGVVLVLVLVLPLALRVR